ILVPQPGLAPLDIYISLMTQAGFNLTNRDNFNHSGQYGLAYVYGAKQYAEPSTGTANCETTLGTGSACRTPLYGLDCSGMIYQMAQCSQLFLDCGGTENYAKVSTWNKAFKGSPLYHDLFMIDSGHVPKERLMPGDIIVTGGDHMGFVISTSNGLA